MGKQGKKPALSLAKKMGISLVCGLVVGMLLLFIRESLTSSGNEALWGTINNLLFQDITAAGAESAIGIFYLIGQLFIRALQLIIVPMVFTSITLAIGHGTGAESRKEGGKRKGEAAKEKGIYLAENF